MNYKVINPFIFTVLCLVVVLLIGNCKTRPTGFSDNTVSRKMTPGDSLEWTDIKKHINSFTAIHELKDLKTYLDKAVHFAKSKGYTDELFKIYIVYSQRLYLFGDIEGGVRILDSASALAEKMHSGEYRALVNLTKASFPRTPDFDTVMYYYKATLRDTAYLDVNAKAGLYFSLSRAYLMRAYYKEAIMYAEMAKNIYLSRNTPLDISNEVNVDIMLYHSHKGIKDTAAAAESVMDAYRLTKDSLGGQGDIYLYSALGDYYQMIRQPDSALLFYDMYSARLEASRSENMYVLPMINKAGLYLNMGNIAQAQQLIAQIEKTGLPESERYARDLQSYYNTKYLLEKQRGNTAQALTAYEKATELENVRHNEEKSAQLANLEESLTKARAEKTIAEKEQKLNDQREYTIGFAVAAFLIAIIGVLVFLNQRRKKLLESERVKALQQQIVIEKTRMRLQAEDEERRRISQEIHDDISPSITVLNMAAKIVGEPKNESEQKRASQIITRNTATLSTQLNEIVWSLNSSNDELGNLTAYIRRFAEKFLEEAGIQLEFKSNTLGDASMVEGYKRRAIYHSVKEVINNAVKYSGTGKVRLLVNKNEGKLVINISDFGKGLESDGNISGSGNGLRNIKQSMTILNGSAQWKNEDGLTVVLTIPIDDDIENKFLRVV